MTGVALPSWPTAGPAAAQLVATIALDPDRVACLGSDAWTSDDPDERARAAACCVSSHCPAQAACRAAAGELDARWGVWGGRDRDRGRRRRAEAVES